MVGVDMMRGFSGLVVGVDMMVVVSDNISGSGVGVGA